MRDSRAQFWRKGTVIALVRHCLILHLGIFLAGPHPIHQSYNSKVEVIHGSD